MLIDSAYNYFHNYIHSATAAGATLFINQNSTSLINYNSRLRFGAVDFYYIRSKIIIIITAFRTMRE